MDRDGSGGRQSPRRDFGHLGWRAIYADTFGAIPIAEALYYKGTGLGTVLAFMMSVTTLSIPSLTMLSRVIKPKLMATFVGLCIIGMCISGYVFNFLQPLF